MKKKEQAPKLFVSLGYDGREPVVVITVNGRETVHVSVELALSFAQAIERTVRLAK